MRVGWGEREGRSDLLREHALDRGVVLLEIADGELGRLHPVEDRRRAQLLRSTEGSKRRASAPQKGRTRRRRWGGTHDRVRLEHARDPGGLDALERREAEQLVLARLDRRLARGEQLAVEVEDLRGVEDGVWRGWAEAAVSTVSSREREKGETDPRRGGGRRRGTSGRGRAGRASVEGTPGQRRDGGTHRLARSDGRRPAVDRGDANYLSRLELAQLVLGALEREREEQRRVRHLALAASKLGDDGPGLRPRPRQRLGLRRGKRG